MKKILSVVISLCVVISGVTACLAEDKNETNVKTVAAYENNDITVVLQIDNPVMTVNGKEINIDENNTAPVIVSGRTLVPVGAIIEELGGSFQCNGYTKEVALTYKNDVIKLTIDSFTAYLNDKENTLDTAPAVINGRTMLPIRFIADSFGFSTEWEENSKTITKKNSEKQE